MKNDFHQITELEVGRVFWESYGLETKDAIIAMLKAKKSLREIEQIALQAIPSNIQTWKRREIAGRYFMAAKYAKTKNLHLDGLKSKPC